MASDQDLPEGSLQNILDQDTLKWVFVGGKGGVGKTTCSSILARVRASVLIISTDPAHNLSDVFQQRFTKTPTLVTGFTNLYAMEVDPTLENEDLPGAVNLVSELANAIPGIDEAMSFAEMLKLVQTMDYSVIVFDTDPTGHTLRLLQFPSTLEKGLAKLMTMKNKFGGLLSQMTGLFGVEDDFGEDAILGRLEGMKGVIKPVNRQFKGPKNWNHFMADRCCILRFLRFLLICGVFLAPVSCSSSECSKDTSMTGFQSDFVMLQHQLRGVFTVLDNCSFRVSEFDMLEGSDVRWWGAVGDNFVNLTNGFVISDDKLNRTYKNDTLVVSLNINVSWDQTKVVSVWDLSMAADFGHVLLHDPSNSSGSLEPAAAPSPDPISVEKRGYEQPTMFENCKVLSPEYRVRWTLLKEENLVEIGLEVATVVQNYMAFGWANPNSTSGYMLFSDVTIAGFTEEDLKPFAEDYYISDYSECTLVSGEARGVCPDSIYVGSDNSDVNNTELVYGHRKDGISFVRFRRPLVSSDKKFDLAVNHTANMTVIWAIGKIKTPDSIRPFYLPQNHGGPRQVTYGYRQLNISEHVNDCLGPLDAADKLDQDLIIADAKVPLVVTTGPTSRYPNPPNPSKVLYINKKEAPLLRVERGVEVKFSVQAGHDVALYITSDIIGGNATMRNASETIYAGGAEFEGVLASPKEMLWTPDRNTPDQVFYQSLFQPKMGWKVQVVDGGLGDMYNNSVVLDDQQVNFFWTLSEDSISIAARGEKKSGYLAIGFGSGMVNSFAYVGWIDEKGKGHISTYYINGKDSSNIHPTKENLTYVRVKSENGIITLEFTRPMKPSCRIGERPECSNIVEPTTPLKIVWAMGTKWSEDHLSEKNMHSSTSSHAVRVMLIRGSAEAEQDLRPVLGVHGFMMFLAWGILLPGGAFAARYLKHVKDDGWYRFHVYLQYSGLSIVLLGFLFAVAELRGLYVSSLHVRFGMAAIVLACAQPINASFRPKKPDDGEAPSPKRLFWEYFHVNLGRCAIIVGAVALFTGMKHLGDRYGEDVGGLTWALALWFLIGVLSGLFLELREKTRKNSGTARGNWVLGNSDEDDSTDLLGSNGIHGVKEAQLSERGELQLEPLNR